MKKVSNGEIEIESFYKSVTVMGRLLLLWPELGSNVEPGDDG